MRKIFAVGTLLSLIAIAPTQTSAQRPFGGGGGFGGGGIMLVTNKSVQEELKITDEQKEKLAEKMKVVGEKRKEAFAKLKEGPKEEFFEKMQAMIKEMQGTAQKEIYPILTAEQIKRLKQIERQQNASATITNDEEVTKELKITDEQKQKFKSISEESGKEMREIMKSMKENPTEAREKLTAMRKEVTDKTLKVLDADQKTKWSEMIGAPFTITFEGSTKSKEPK